MLSIQSVVLLIFILFKKIVIQANKTRPPTCSLNEVYRGQAYILFTISNGEYSDLGEYSSINVPQRLLRHSLTPTISLSTKWNDRLTTQDQSSFQNNLEARMSTILWWNKLGKVFIDLCNAPFFLPNSIQFGNFSI